MSEIQESNICPMCGGLIQFEYVFTFDRCKPFSIRVEPASLTPFTFCPGHPEPEQKHDGNLDEEERYTVSHWNGKGYPFVRIEGRYATYGQDEVSLDAKQALSLLVWLKQEQETLQKLVLIQEQEHE